MAFGYDKVSYKAKDYHEWNELFGEELSAKLKQAVEKAQTKYVGKEITIHFSGKATSDGRLQVNVLTTSHRRFPFFRKSDYRLDPMIVVSSIK